MRLIISTVGIPVMIAAVTVAFLVRAVFGRPTRSDLYP